MKKFGLFIGLLVVFGMFTSCQSVSTSVDYTPEETEETDSSSNTPFVRDYILSSYEYQIAKLCYDISCGDYVYYDTSYGDYDSDSLNYFTENYTVLQTKDGLDILLDYTKEEFLWKYFLRNVVVFYNDGHVHTYRCELDDKKILKTYTSSLDSNAKVMAYLEILLPDYPSDVSSIVIIAIQRDNWGMAYNKYIKLARQ